MKKLNLSLAAVFCILLSGCATTDPIIPTTKYIVVEPTPELLKKCEVTPPTSIDDYLSKTKEQREQDLAQYSTNLIKDLAICNSRWQALPKWFEDQKKAYGN